MTFQNDPVWRREYIRTADTDTRMWIVGLVGLFGFLGLLVLGINHHTNGTPIAMFEPIWNESTLSQLH